VTINQEKMKRRKEDRVAVSLQVSMKESSYVANNISPSGIYFEVGDTFNVGEMVDFTVDLSTHSGDAILKCNGEIVRVEDQNGKIGVAVKILKSKMEFKK
jgi:hypothetical protein